MDGELGHNALLGVFVVVIVVAVVVFDLESRG